MQQDVSRVARKLNAGGRNVVFTGAGISTESGISDYRSKGGIWDKFRPVYFDEFMSSRQSRIEYWRQKSELYPELIKARPNAAHQAIFRLYQLGLLTAVITQNIDGLHQESGLPDERVVELHGSNRRVRCTGCGALSSLEDAHRRIEAGDPAPECSCGGFLKPDTVSFGQAMPTQAVAHATRLSSACDVFIVIGSTLLVQPAALMPVYAKQNGAFLVLINLSETPCDDLCDVRIQAKAGKTMMEILGEVERYRSGRPSA